jgi:DNA-binding beta-propeller fold protein YncE
VTYNFRDISSACAKKVPEQVGGGSYTGIVDSHPFATAMMADGTAVVADAAGNDIITVSPSGFRTEIATLPGQPLKVTKALAAQFHFPGCTVGHKYWFEPVPTDVEIHDGLLYVSLLPGGPEDPSLGARGKVYTVDPSTGAMKQIGKGFAGATDLAVSPKGKVYVAELFGGQISTIKNGVAKRVIAVEEPAAVEWYKGKLFVAGGLQGPGWIRKFTP